MGPCLYEGGCDGPRASAGTWVCLCVDVLLCVLSFVFSECWFLGGCVHQGIGGSWPLSPDPIKPAPSWLSVSPLPLAPRCILFGVLFDFLYSFVGIILVDLVVCFLPVSFV